MAKEGGSSGITSTDSGGSLSPYKDPATGHFLPGNRAGGRKPKAVERAYLDAVRNALPPEQVEDIIAKALDIALKQNSWRGLVEVLQLTLAYGAGKPTQRVVSSDGNLEQLLAVLQDSGPLLPGQPATSATSVGVVGMVATSVGQVGEQGSVNCDSVDTETVD